MLMLAEREGFEPPVHLRVLRISSAARSTTLPPLQAIGIKRFFDKSASRPWLRLLPNCYPIAFAAVSMAALMAESTLPAASSCMPGSTCE
jgi:hypothetical protein